MCILDGWEFLKLCSFARYIFDIFLIATMKKKLTHAPIKGFSWVNYYDHGPEEHTKGFSKVPLRWLEIPWNKTPFHLYYKCNLCNEIYQLLTICMYA